MNFTAREKKEGRFFAWKPAKTPQTRAALQRLGRVAVPLRAFVVRVTAGPRGLQQIRETGHICRKRDPKIAILQL